MPECKNEHMEEPVAKRRCSHFDECSSTGIGFLVWFLLLEFETWNRERNEELLDDILCVPWAVNVCYILRACASKEPEYYCSGGVGFHQQPQYWRPAGSDFEPNSGAQSTTTYRNRS